MKIILAEDSGLLRDSLAGMLERQGIQVVAQCEDADQLLEAVAAQPDVDVVVTDVRMPPLMRDDGLTAATAIRAKYPHIGILVCSQYAAPAYARSALELTYGSAGAGGVGYVLKDSVANIAEFLETLRAVANRQVILGPEIAESLARHDHQGRAIEMLTEREREVLEAMAQGKSNPDIAAELYLSEAGVSKHIASIFQKLGFDAAEPNRRVKAILQYLAYSYQRPL
ncbi:two-component system response regulator [Corynebacterium renale]|uniref:response regulator transcription factor n=1 Tax=Corynebacterium renale TaxID=1724 RepID=UPI000DA27C87|nr:response regulator transcription factor [Corynebacterium renale]SQG65165.1 two-component system response regulator [Corynebacterium renale]STC98149.1 two-component system response regulator [Corynebacterium renale]